MDVSRSDQEAYLSYAQNMYETGYNLVGGRNRMPAFSFLLSLLYSPELTQNQFFARSKDFNIVATAALLPGLFWLFRRTLPFLLSVNLWLITTFTVLIFKAGYAQAELLFYFLSFFGFFLMLRMLQQPSWKLGLLTGIVLGLAHLTKASVLPGFLLFVLAFVAQSGYSAVTQWRFSSQRIAAKLEQIKKENISRLLSLVLAAVAFLGVIYPYISTSRQYFGHYFYNVNSTFYMWYDSWEEAEAGTRKYGDGKGYPEMPSHLIPSPQKYLREHSSSEILSRFKRGIDRVILVASKSYGYFKYILLFGAIALLLSAVHWRTTLAIVKRHFFLISFCLSYFVAYLLIYAWYTPVASGNRFTLALFMPLLFFLGTIVHTQHRHHPFISLGSLKLKWFYLFNFVTLGMILFELHPILSDRILTTFGGS
ncbi:hypothetical protein [Leptolyngbya ohadii]|uniref:hypothetical protein n=1 Tax=Leptolyngbya ohadii TaxID=1962290 RepID=UPI001179E54F|nr:hypothetical protein [Leptolyngbya ohadii]